MTVSVVEVQSHVLRLVFNRQQQTVVVGTRSALNLSHCGECRKRGGCRGSAESKRIHAIVDYGLVIAMVAHISDLETCRSADLLLDLQAVLFVRRVVDILVGVENRGRGEVGVCGKD